MKISQALSPAALLLPLLLAGCSSLQTTVARNPGQLITGSVHGGQQPISGASLQLYAAGTTGQGSAATPLLAAPVLTGADGSFNFTLASPCPGSNTLVYLAATGGNPGLAAGTNNPASVALDAIGTCAQLAQAPYFSINEATTVAAVSALAPFYTSPAALGASPANASALAAAFTLAGQFTSPFTGKSPGINLPAGYTAPQPTLYTLADAIAPCINSTGTDGNCATLFSYTTPTSGAPVPVDVTGALLNVANNPTLNTSQLFSLSTPASPFQPNLTQSPANFALALVPTTTTLSFSSLAFPNAASTFPTPPQDVTVTNTGQVTAVFASTPFTISGANATDFTQISDCTTLAPNATCDVLLTATPIATGTRTATLTPSANLTQPQSLPLTVIGTVPAGQLTIKVPGQYSYAAFPYEFAWIDITATNTGSVPVTFKPAFVYSSVIKTNTCVGTLQPGTACVVTLEDNALNANGTLYLYASSSSTPYDVAINNSNSMAVTNPTFPLTPLGSSSTATFTATVTPNGGANYPVSYTGSMYGPAAADYSPSNPTCMGSGASGSSTYATCTFKITFTPSAAGVRVARLGDGNYYVPLNGVGTVNGVVNQPSFTIPTAQNISATLTYGNPVSVSTSLTITNNGSTTLAFPSIPLYSGAPGAFSQTNNCTSVASGASCTIMLTFTTATPVTTTTNLILKDASSGLSQTVVVNASANYPSPSVSPSIFQFGTISVGTSSAPQSMTVTGTPGHTINIKGNAISSGTASAFSFSGGGTCTIGSSGTCTFSILFTPPSSGTDSIYFEALDPASNLYALFDVAGTGSSSPQPTFNPTSVRFPNTAVGSTSTASATLTNTGYATLTISSLGLNYGGSLGFSQTNNCPASLAIGASCTIKVVFSPTTGNGTASGNLQLVSNYANSPTNLALIGVIVANPQASFPVSSIGFANTSVGSGSTTSTTLTNTGGAALNLSSIGISGATNSNFTQTNNCPASLASNAYCTITLTFSPKVTGSQSATLQVVSNSATSPDTVALSGTGK